MENFPPLMSSPGPGRVRREYPLRSPEGPDKAQQKIAKELEQAADPNRPIPLPAEPKGNHLGDHFAGIGPKAMPTAKTLVKRWFTPLSKVADMPRLKAGQAALREQQQIMQEHSPIITETRVRALSDAYAKNPTPENFEALRHAKTLEPADHARTQHYAQIKCREILAELSPAIRPVCAKAAELAKEEANGHWRAMCAIYVQGYELPTPDPSPLILGLQDRANEFRNLSECKQPFGSVPELIEELLRMDQEKIEALAPQESPAAQPPTET